MKEATNHFELTPEEKDYLCAVTMRNSPCTGIDCDYRNHCEGCPFEKAGRAYDTAIVEIRRILQKAQ